MHDAASRFRYRKGDVIPGANVRVIRCVGAGGHGTVYEVQHLHLEEEYYILKVVRAELLGGKRSRSKIEREVKHLSKLRHHPNIVRVVWAGWTTDTPSVFYFAMERLSGVTLRQLLHSYKRAGLALPLEFVFYIALALLRALQHAHESGIVHRDVKPENIFVHFDADPSKPWTVKLLDFGISTILSEGRKTTTSSGFTGTYAYAAPEQFLGERVSPATDVYALGLLVYEMIAGRGPFEERRTDAELAEAHVRAEPQPLACWRDVPAALEIATRRMLDKDPSRRPRAAELEGMVEEIRAAARTAMPLEFSTAERPLWKSVPDWSQSGEQQAVTALEGWTDLGGDLSVELKTPAPLRVLRHANVDASGPTEPPPTTSQREPALSLSLVESLEIPSPRLEAFKPESPMIGRPKSDPELTARAPREFALAHEELPDSSNPSGIFVRLPVRLLALGVLIGAGIIAGFLFLRRGQQSQTSSDPQPSPLDGQQIRAEP